MRRLAGGTGGQSATSSRSAQRTVWRSPAPLRGRTRSTAAGRSAAGAAYPATHATGFARGVSGQQQVVTWLERSTSAYAQGGSGRGGGHGDACAGLARSWRRTRTLGKTSAQDAADTKQLSRLRYSLNGASCKGRRCSVPALDRGQDDVSVIGDRTRPRHSAGMVVSTATPARTRRRVASVSQVLLCSCSSLLWLLLGFFISLQLRLDYTHILCCFGAVENPVAGERCLVAALAWVVSSVFL